MQMRLRAASQAANRDKENSGKRCEDGRRGDHSRSALRKIQRNASPLRGGFEVRVACRRCAGVLAPFFGNRLSKGLNAQRPTLNVQRPIQIIERSALDIGQPAPFPLRR
jgi:hypothetical protein